VLPLAVDEDFNNHIVRGVRRRNPDVDIVRVQDAGLTGAQDSSVLEWAAAEGRVLFTHDVNTMTDHAYRRA
jgi:predicted nuclease of predicted toxin-antitoxin system